MVSQAQTSSALAGTSIRSTYRADPLAKIVGSVENDDEDLPQAKILALDRDVYAEDGPRDHGDARRAES